MRIFAPFFFGVYTFSMIAWELENTKLILNAIETQCWCYFIVSILALLQLITSFKNINLLSLTVDIGFAAF